MDTARIVVACRRSVAFGDIDDAAAILGYQMRIGAERRFGDEAEDFDVVRTELPDPSQKSRWTAKNVAYFVRS